MYSVSNIKNNDGYILPYALLVCTCVLIVFCSLAYHLETKKEHIEMSLAQKRLLLIAKQVKYDIIVDNENNNLDLGQRYYYYYNEGYAEVIVGINEDYQYEYYTITMYTENGKAQAQFRYYLETLEYLWLEYR